MVQAVVVGGAGGSKPSVLQAVVAGSKPSVLQAVAARGAGVWTSEGGHVRSRALSVGIGSSSVSCGMDMGTERFAGPSSAASGADQVRLSGRSAMRGCKDLVASHPFNHLLCYVLWEESNVGQDPVITY